MPSEWKLRLWDFKEDKTLLMAEVPHGLPELLPLPEALILMSRPDLQQLREASRIWDEGLGQPELCTLPGPVLP